MERVNSGYLVNKNKPINAIVCSLFISMCLYHDSIIIKQMPQTFENLDFQMVKSFGNPSLKNYKIGDSTYMFDEGDERTFNKKRMKSKQQYLVIF